MVYKRGDIVLIPIPFTDLASNRKRPVLILSASQYNENTKEMIVAAITSNFDKNVYAVKIKQNDLREGNLFYDSWVRADKLYTLPQAIVVIKFGSVKDSVLAVVTDKILDIFEH